MITSDTDLLLFDRMKHLGDKVAYRDLYLRYYPPLLSYAGLFTTMSESEDIVQDVLMKLWEQRSSINIRQSLSSYLFLSVRNASLNHLRRGVVHTKAVSELKLSLIDEAADFNVYHISEIKSMIMKTLRSLPEEQRLAFEMNRFEGMTYSQIAAQTGVSVKTVEYRVSRALRALEKELSDYLPLLAMVLSLMAGEHLS